jgi:hypothetical protein
MFLTKSGKKGSWSFFVCDQFGLANGILGNVASCKGAKPVGIFFLNLQVLDLPLWKQKS